MNLNAAFIYLPPIFGNEHLIGLLFLRKHCGDRPLEGLQELGVGLAGVWERGPEIMDGNMPVSTFVFSRKKIDSAAPNSSTLFLCLLSAQNSIQKSHYQNVTLS